MCNIIFISLKNKVLYIDYRVPFAMGTPLTSAMNKYRIDFTFSKSQHWNCKAVSEIHILPLLTITNQGKEDQNGPQEHTGFYILPNYRQNDVKALELIYTYTISCNFICFPTPCFLHASSHIELRSLRGNGCHFYPDQHFCLHSLYVC